MERYLPADKYLLTRWLPQLKVVKLKVSLIEKCLVCGLSPRLMAFPIPIHLTLILNRSVFVLKSFICRGQERPANINSFLWSSVVDGVCLQLECPVVLSADYSHTVNCCV